MHLAERENDDIRRLHVNLHVLVGNVLQNQTYARIVRRHASNSGRGFGIERLTDDQQGRVARVDALERLDQGLHTLVRFDVPEE